jgi:hypothetical protein
MRKTKFDERKPMHKIARYYQEKLINLTDLDHKNITNDRVRKIFGSLFKFDSYHQRILINDLIRLGLIKRNGQQTIEILPICV